MGATDLKLLCTSAIRSGVMVALFLSVSCPSVAETAHAAAGVDRIEEPAHEPARTTFSPLILVLLLADRCSCSPRNRCLHLIATDSLWRVAASATMARVEPPKRVCRQTFMSRTASDEVTDMRGGSFLCHGSSCNRYCVAPAARTSPNVPQAMLEFEMRNDLCPRCLSSAQSLSQF